MKANQQISKKLKAILLFCFVNIVAFSFAQTSNTLPATGNVGVGTLTPATKLEVVGNTALKGAVTVKDSVTIQKRLTVNQNIKIQGKSVFVNKVRCKNNINVLGNGIFKNNLVVDSLARFKSKLVVDGLTKMKGNAIVLGNLKLPNLSTTNNPALFLTTNAHGKVGGLSNSKLISAIYQPQLTCRTDQNGNILSVWKQTPHPNYGILYTGTDCPTRVGIGIATPIATLDVNGNGYFSQTLEVGSNATPIAFPTQVKINAINRQAGLLLINRPIATSSIPLYGIKNIVNTNTINAYAVTQESTNQDVFVVKGDGSVGIGTATPQATLDVNGNALFSGKVGIGTTAITENFMLTVQGAVRARSIQVDATSIIWSDYVFAQNYQLKPLKELENYITKNKHLPEVPTTKEVKEEGINLGEMDAILLKKVEELTLYVIAQQKKIEALEKQIKK